MLIINDRNFRKMTMTMHEIDEKYAFFCETYSWTNKGNFVCVLSHI